MGFGSRVDRPRWQNFSPAHHMRWERKPDLGFIKRNWDKRGLMECQKLLSREAWEEVGIKVSCGLQLTPWWWSVTSSGQWELVSRALMVLMTQRAETASCVVIYYIPTAIVGHEVDFFNKPISERLHLICWCLKNFERSLLV
ncbi:diphosphoinositol polyphosphate phosphohydrolase 1 isoform X2 [Tyto alba]|uniref:diphosphoinositol polyphosphate phosphohydrolase 1 isoform X2 n=1 Tax=Tyto alba TaxID=56313 RepID=UPI001C66C2B2|nr:diphosphoinositol polyphosphate phosphohydrolase 1 isoform X2 [Tyto alba]